MIQCVDLRADVSIRKAAITTGDSRIIGLASRDLVAAEAWYHGQCYRDYTRTDKVGKCSVLKSESDSDEISYCNIESRAYDKLFEFIRSDFLENPRLIKMIDLREKFISYMRSLVLLRYLNQQRNICKESWKQNSENSKIFWTITSFLFFPKIFQRHNWQERW